MIGEAIVPSPRRSRYRTSAELRAGIKENPDYLLDCRQLADTINSGKVDVTFRSSELIARKTVDLFDIWKGEIIFKDVPMLQKK